MHRCASFHQLAAPREGRAGEDGCPSLQPSSWKFGGLAVGEGCSSGELGARGGRTGQRAERVLAAPVAEPWQRGARGAVGAKRPCLEERALCNEQCHLLGAAGMGTLWSAGGWGLSGFMFVCLWGGGLVGWFGPGFFSL